MGLNSVKTYSYDMLCTVDEIHFVEYWFVIWFVGSVCITDGNLVVNVLVVHLGGYIQAQTIYFS